MKIIKGLCRRALPLAKLLAVAALACSRAAALVSAGPSQGLAAQDLVVCSCMAYVLFCIHAAYLQVALTVLWRMHVRLLLMCACMPYTCGMQGTQGMCVHRSCDLVQKSCQLG